MAVDCMLVDDELRLHDRCTLHCMVLFWWSRLSPASLSAARLLWSSIHWLHHDGQMWLFHCQL